MNCPECNSENTLYMHEDHIPCMDCESVIVVGYSMCTACNYSFRTTNGKFLDGTYPVEIDQVLKDMVDDVMGGSSEGGCGGCTGCSPKSMLDSVCNCVKCGQALILSVDTINYNCPHCGFEWDILEGE